MKKEIKIELIKGKDKWQVFEKEIDLINDCKLRQFVRIALERAYPTFYSNGASRDHHHKTKYGLVRHIKECVYLAREKIRQYNYDNHYGDLLVAAMLLHDLTKYVYHEDENMNRTKYKIHPITVRSLLWDLADIIGHNDFDMIMRGIESHMGIFWNYTKYPETQFERDCYDCDYFASRVNIQIPIIGEDIKLGRQYKEGTLKVEK